MSNYKPSQQALEFISFIRAANVEDNTSPEIHYRLADRYFGREKRVVIESFRGSAKSTLMEWYVIYAAALGEVYNFGNVDFIAFVGDSAENGGKNFSRNIATKIDKSDFLRKYITLKRRTDNEMEFVNSSGKEMFVKIYGMKALSLFTKLHSESNDLTIGNCKVGDTIIGANGKPCIITHKSEVFNKPMYRITLKDKRYITVSDDHINSVVKKVITPGGKRHLEHINLTTMELLNEQLVLTKKHTPTKPNHSGVSSTSLLFIENTREIEYTPKKFSLDPYTLGVLLGDGSMNGNQPVRASGNLDDLKILESYIPYTFGKYNHDKRTKSVYSVGIKGLQTIVKDLGVNTHGDVKAIPGEYFLGAIPQRLALLQGLMDTDGTISKTGRTTFCSNSKELVLGVMRLCRSLGGKATMTRNRKAYLTELWLNKELFKLPRKLCRQKYDRDTKTAIVSIDKVEVEPSQCIAVDNEEHQFIVDDYVRTHNTNIRGVRYKGFRPDIVILDDVTTNEAMTSEVIQKTINDNFYKSIVPALHPTRYKIFFIGTPISENDILHQLQNNSTWTVHRFPICDKFPCSKEDFRGNWEDRFPYDAVKEKYNMYKGSGELQSFYQEYMLELTDLSTLIVDVEVDIKWFEPSGVLAMKGNYNFYITTDFAVSQKESADFSTIGVWAISSKGDWMLVDGQCRRQEMTDNIDDLFKLAQKYMPMAVGIETSGQQGGFISWIEKEMITRNIFFTLAKKIGTNTVGIRPTSDKLQRFVTGVAARFKQGKVWLPKQSNVDVSKTNIRLQELTEELVNELSKLTMAGGVKSLKHDDALDLLNQLSEIDIYLPSANQIDMIQKKDDSVWHTDYVEENIDTSYDVM